MENLTIPYSESERRKYVRMWKDEGYRINSPGLRILPHFLNAADWHKGESIVDIGCGSGKAAVGLREAGFNVIGFDIADNCLDEGAGVPLMVGCLWEAHIPPQDWFYCTDVMEHIPREHVDGALEAVKASSRRGGFLNIATFASTWHTGAVLHLTVEQRDWWMAKINKLWKSVKHVEAEWFSLSVLVEN